MTISFGDNVRIVNTPETIETGLAGLIGNVAGETTPSVTNVEVIGELKEDYAFNVFFDERQEGFWFAPTGSLRVHRSCAWNRNYTRRC